MTTGPTAAAIAETPARQMKNKVAILVVINLRLTSAMTDSFVLSPTSPELGKTFFPKVGRLVEFGDLSLD
jgi:hypothetical protein